jgi:serpin B
MTMNRAAWWCDGALIGFFCGVLFGGCTSRSGEDVRAGSQAVDLPSADRPRAKIQVAAPQAASPETVTVQPTPAAPLTHVLIHDAAMQVHDEQGSWSVITIPAGTRVRIKARGGWECIVLSDDGREFFVSGSSLRAIGEVSEEEITADVGSLAAANNLFAVELYQQWRTRQGNFFFSPMSIWIACSMVYAGAEGTTKAELATALGIDLSDQPLYEAVQVVNRILNSNAAGTGYRLRMANRLWGQRGNEFAPDFLALTRAKYDAELTTVDFQRQPVEAADAINAWVERMTEGKLRNVISPQAFHGLTRLVLTNAIYFYGDWTLPFSESETQVKPFHVARGQNSSVPLMYRRGGFAWQRHDGVQILRLPYGINGRLSMIVVLPDDVYGLAAFEEQFTARSLALWLDDGEGRDVHVYLPRFRMKSEYMLKETLRELGVSAAFDQFAADLSRISPHERLFLDAAMHQAVVEVNERGTEAAAVTALSASASAPEQEPPEPVVFRADHPFLFLIHDDWSGAILFLGRVADPSQRGAEELQPS